MDSSIAAVTMPNFNAARHPTDTMSSLPLIATAGGQHAAKELTKAIMTERVNKIDPATCDLDEAATFVVGDLGEVYRQNQRWKLNLPKVKPHYGTYPAHEDKR